MILTPKTRRWCVSGRLMRPLYSDWSWIPVFDFLHPCPKLNCVPATFPGKAPKFSTGACTALSLDRCTGIPQTHFRPPFCTALSSPVPCPANSSGFSGSQILISASLTQQDHYALLSLHRPRPQTRNCPWIETSDAYRAHLSTFPYLRDQFCTPVTQYLELLSHTILSFVTAQGRILNQLPRHGYK